MFRLNTAVMKHSPTSTTNSPTSYLLSELKLRLACSSEAYLIFDENQRVIFSNTAAQVIFGRSAEELASQNLSLPRAYMAYRMEITRPQNLRPRMVELKLLENFGIGSLVSVADLTLISELEQSLQRAERSFSIFETKVRLRLQRLIRKMQSLKISSMEEIFGKHANHDLRQLALSISLSSQMIERCQRNPNDERAQNFKENLIKEIERLSLMIDRLELQESNLSDSVPSRLEPDRHPSF